ncbi:MAG TPA: hypothetical protein VN682_10295 [Terriglobales bacterium]|nr:hypothetical protein [Terriglobales bacterium]
MVTDAQLERLKDVIQDCNLNFLLGSGLSSPYLRTLGNIETLLARVEQSNLEDAEKQVLRCSLYKLYFDDVMAKNLAVLKADQTAAENMRAYNDFLRTLNSILLRRRSSLLGKEVNLFTTNIDVFLEKAIEEIGLESNDGFNGRFKPLFSLSNFNKSRFKRSLHFDNLSELPVFNLFKLHGSLTWIMENDTRIVFSPDLAQVERLKQVVIPSGCLVEVTAESTIEGLAKAVSGLTVHESLTKFLSVYEEFLIVNPTKEKFKHTLLNYTYYELLRIFSNELEKDNSVLFVMGFSFADEHIKEITLRAANSNPTLIVYVIAHSSKSADAIRGHFGKNSIKNANIQFIAPTLGPDGDDMVFDLATINREILGKLFKDESPQSAPSDFEEEE